MTEKKPFCIMAHTHLNFKHQGMVTACWRNQAKLGDYRSQTIEEIWNGTEFKDLREQLDSGNFPPGCKSCLDLESSGADSTRTNCNKKYLDKYEPGVIKTIEIRFNNLCNLRCLHCNNKYSSKWEVEVKRNPEINKLYKDEKLSNLKSKDFLPQKMIDDIVENVAPTVEEITITGGEPLIQKEHDIFLERILPYAKNITLNYSSNLNTIKTVTDLWKHFKRINVIVSIDSEPETYSYLRTFGTLSDVEENIRYLQENTGNVKIFTTCTTSLYNITRFPKIISYYNSLGTLFHTSLVQYPEVINIKVLPQELKEQVTKEVLEALEGQNDRVKSFTTNVITYMNSEDLYYLWDRTKRYVETMDKLNNTDFLETYPEFRKYW